MQTGRWSAQRGMGRRVAAVASAAVLAIAVGACGSGSTSAPHSTGAKAVPDRLPAAQVRTLLRYTGGSRAGAADRSATPIRIGFINQQGGAGGFPTFGSQFRSAIALINRQLGGIGGHPIRVTSCYVVSAEEEALQCAQRFANTPGIRLVVEGSLIVGASSLHSVLDARRIPITGALGLDPSDAVSRTSFFTSSGSFATVPDYVEYARRYLHVKSAALLTVSGNAVSELVGREMKLGMQTAHVKVTSSSFASGQTDVVGPLSAAGAQEAGLIVPLAITPQQCLGTATTLKTLGISNTPVLALYGCAGLAIKRQFGDYPRWTYAAGYVSDLAPAANATERAAIAAYRAWFAPLAAGGDGTNGIIILQSAIQAVNFLNGGGGASSTHASIVRYGKSWRGPIFMGPPVHYGAIASLPALPGLAERFYTYKGNGDWIDDTHGRWLSGTLGE